MKYLIMLSMLISGILANSFGPWRDSTLEHGDGRDPAGVKKSYRDTYSAPEYADGATIAIGHFDSRHDDNIVIVNGKRIVEDRDGNTNVNRGTYAQGRDEGRTSIHRSNSAPEGGYNINVGSFGSGISGDTIISDITVAEGHGGDANVNRRTYGQGSDGRGPFLHRSGSAPENADDVNVGSFGTGRLGDTIISGKTFVQGQGSYANDNKGTYAQGRDEKRTSSQSAAERGTIGNKLTVMLILILRILIAHRL